MKKAVCIIICLIHTVLSFGITWEEYKMLCKLNGKEPTLNEYKFLCNEGVTDYDYEDLDLDDVVLELDLGEEDNE